MQHPSIRPRFVLTSKQWRSLVQFIAYLFIGGIWLGSGGVLVDAWLGEPESVRLVSPMHKPVAPPSVYALAEQTAGRTNRWEGKVVDIEPEIDLFFDLLNEDPPADESLGRVETQIKEEPIQIETESVERRGEASEPLSDSGRALPTDASLSGAESTEGLLPDAPALPFGQLLIPDIQLFETIVDVPLEQGRWNINDLDDRVGLLDGVGRFPGDHYSMVFTAHVTTEWPVHGPFFELDRLFPGDEIIYRVGETDYIYTITRMLYVDPEQAEKIVEPNGDQIILVTCGQLNFLTRQYAKRLVVKAELTRTESHDFR